MSDNGLLEAVSMMMNIVNTVCEHEPDLTVTSLLNYLDLYRIYLAYDTSVGEDVLAEIFGTITIKRELNDYASFEQFVGDSKLLRFAAATATIESGGSVATPPPLKYCPNSNHL